VLAWVVRAMRLSWPSILAVAAIGAGCSGQVISSGSCLTDSSIACQNGFVGYSCTGAVRPDEIASVNHVVTGFVCDPQGTQASGAEGFCCTPSLTDCAYDPRTVCPDGTFGYSCMGTNRPDSFDPQLTCTQGIKTGGLIAFCCGPNFGDAGVASCARNANFPCTTGTLGFRCTGSALPTEGDLGVDQSRSETPLLCSLPTPDPLGGAAGALNDYCCYAPTQAPIGYSCLQDQTVQGCRKGDFGFACKGTDTPDQDYPRMACNEGSVPGTSSLGYAATLYCCTLVQ